MAKKIGAGGEPQGYDTKNGRYEKDGGATAETKSEHEKAIDIYSDTPEEDKKNAPLKSVQKPEIAYGFANKERKNTRHHKDHAKEMGYKNQRWNFLIAIKVNCIMVMQEIDIIAIMKIRENMLFQVMELFILI